MSSFYQYFIITVIFFMLIQFAIILSFSTSPPAQVVPAAPSKTHMLKLWREVDRLKQDVRAMEESVYALQRNIPQNERRVPEKSRKNVQFEKPRLPKSEAKSGLLAHYSDAVRQSIAKKQSSGGSAEGAKSDVNAASEGKYPDRRITFTDFETIKLKPTKWSVHPEQATGKLCLRKWKPLEQALAFIHIGKAAGTTMDSMLGTAKFKNLPSCSGFMRKNVNSASMIIHNLDGWHRRCPICFFCGAHNDFHYLEMLEAKKGVEYLMENIAPVSWIREPASREVSQFYFAQTKTRVIDKNFKFSDWIWKMALKPETIRGTNSLFADGSSGVMWFSGTVADIWVNGGMPDAEKVWKEERRRLLEEPIETLRAAVKNHDKFLWVGIVENWDNSVEMLEQQGDLTFTRGKTVANKNPNKGASAAEKELLRMAYPMDTAFYKYASEVNRMKWELYNSAVLKGTVESIWCKSNEEAREFTIPFYFNGTRIV